MDQHATYVAVIGDVGADDLPLVGGKGANLGELTRAGLPVPKTFCVTTDAYRAFVAEAQLSGPIAEHWPVANMMMSLILPSAPDASASCSRCRDRR